MCKCLWAREVALEQPLRLAPMVQVRSFGLPSSGCAVSGAISLAGVRVVDSVWLWTVLQLSICGDVRQYEKGT